MFFFSVEYYLNNLYGDFNLLNDEEKKQYKKDEDFIIRYYSVVNRMFDDYGAHVSNPEVFINPDKRYLRSLIDECKNQYDRETIIVEYARYIFSKLNKVSFISSNFKTFIDVMNFERGEQEKFKDIPEDKRRINIQKLYKLIEDFISEVVGSQDMLEEFKKLEINGNINSVFDETFGSANKLIHGFISYYTNKNMPTSLEGEEHDMFNEFLCVYYEIVFINYMDYKGYLKNGEREQLISSRLKSEYNEDSENAIIMLLDLCEILRNNGKIEKNDIIDILRNYLPDEEIQMPLIDKREIQEKDIADILRISDEKSYQYLWDKAIIISNYCKKTKTTPIDPIISRFNMGLALITSADLETVKRISRSIFNGNCNRYDEFLNMYMELTNQAELPISPNYGFEPTIRGTRSRVEKATEYFRDLLAPLGLGF